MLSCTERARQQWMDGFRWQRHKRRKWFSVPGTQSEMITYNIIIVRAMNLRRTQNASDFGTNVCAFCFVCVLVFCVSTPSWSVLCTHTFEVSHRACKRTHKSAPRARMWHRAIPSSRRRRFGIACRNIFAGKSSPPSTMRPGGETTHTTMMPGRASYANGNECHSDDDNDDSRGSVDAR